MTTAELQETGIPYEDMLKAGMHFGRKKTVFHPAMGKYVFTVRDGISILDLLKTQEALGEAVEFLNAKLAGGGIVLFVAPTKQAHDGILSLAKALGMPYVLDRWLGGTLTNFKVISGRVKRLEAMEQSKAKGELEKYTKKERLLFDRDLEKMARNFDGLKKMTRMPDAVFVASVKEGRLPINEAHAMGVPVVGIANTDADPKLVSAVIPANDRSKISVDLILQTLERELGKAVAK